MTGRSIALEARHVEAQQETLDRLRLELAELHASRQRLVLEADADRRRLEHDLHEGLQQHLVALAVKLQLAGRSADSDPEAARALLGEMERDLQQAIDETAQLAQRIYPPLLETGGLAAALRAAVMSMGVPASVDVTARADYPPEVASTIYFCCLEALELAGGDTRATVTVRDDEGALAFDVVRNDVSESGLDHVRDRLDALGGRLTLYREPGGGTTRISGSLPLSR